MHYFLIIVGMISCTMIQAAQSPSHNATLEIQSPSSLSPNATSLHQVHRIQNNDQRMRLRPTTTKEKIIFGAFVSIFLGAASWGLYAVNTQVQALPSTTLHIMANNCSTQCPQGFHIESSCMPPSSEINTIRDQILAICPSSSESLLLQEVLTNMPSQCTPITEHIKNLNKTCKSSSSDIRKNHYKNSAAIRHARKRNK